jgi:Putative Actinobacterial Holin-X, holin superfamily III
VSRLVELVTQLFTERVELARGELQVGARQAGRRAAWGIGGALLVAVAIALFAAASVEALAPLVHNRALRLCLVALPLAVVGLVLMRRARQ